MKLCFLLDTNVLSEPLRPRPAAAVVGKIERHQGEVATTSTVFHEMLFGCLRLPDGRLRRAIRAYLDDLVIPSIPMLPYDANAAEWHALERARLAANGLTPPFADGQIAAIAAVNDLTLVTNDRSAFSRFKGLRIERWHR